MNDKPNDGEMEKSNYIDNINYFLLLFLFIISLSLFSSRSRYQNNNTRPEHGKYKPFRSASHCYYLKCVMNLMGNFWINREGKDKYSALISFVSSLFLLSKHNLLVTVTISLD